MNKSQVERQTTDQLNRLRVDIADTIRQYFRPLFFLTLFVAMFLIVLIGVGFYTNATMATMALAASVQVAFGMVIGFVCVYIGLMMTWFGIDAAYTVKGSLGAGDVKGEGSLKSASPGLLFALGGIVLIAVSLYKPIVYEEHGAQPTFQQSLGTSGEGGMSAPKPKPPTTINVTPADGDSNGAAE
jgi:hypothetical protein